MSRPGDPPLFLYGAADTALHRVGAGVKLVALLLIAPFAFASGPHVLAALSAALAVATALSRPNPGELLRLARVVAGYGILMAAFRLAGRPVTRAAALEGLSETALYLWRLALVTVSGGVFYRTTSGIEIREALTRARARVVSLIPPLARLPDPVLSLSLTMIFIPRVFAVWTALDRSWLARGGECRVRRNPFARAYHGGRKLVILLPVLVSNLLSMAETTERAMRNRSA